MSAVLRRDIIGDLISEQGDIKASTVVPSTASFFPLLRTVGEAPPTDAKIDVPLSKSLKLTGKHAVAAMEGEGESEEGSGQGQEAQKEDEDNEEEKEEEEEEEEEGGDHSGIDDCTFMILASVTTLQPPTPLTTTSSRYSLHHLTSYQQHTLTLPPRNLPPHHQ